MGDLVNLAEYRDHLKGEAECLACKHRWVAITNIGQTSMDCPQCGLSRGYFRGCVIPEDILECPCGHTLFYICQDNGPTCQSCGLVVPIPDY